MRFTPHPYQRRAIDWVLGHRRCLLFLDMGLGKTVSTLTAVSRLLDYGEAARVLVVAPKKVAESTWSSEAAKWDHLSHLRVSVVMGTAAQRRKALLAEAEVYVTSRDQVVWLVNESKGRLPFDMVVLDELTSFKNPQSQRFKALRKGLSGVERVVGLTGTPTPNGLPDLWAQVYCIDSGERLEKFVTRFRERWFKTVERNNVTIKIWPKPGAEEEILGLLSDIALTMRAEDYLELPPLVEETFFLSMGEGAEKRYEAFRRERVMELERDDRGGITADSAAALLNKLSQFANGAVYEEAEPSGAGGAAPFVEVHAAKLEALEEIVEGAGSPVLVFYQYQHDRERILKRFAKLKPRVYGDARDLEDWNAGKIALLLAHPSATAFGLNMQSGGHTIVWFSTGWNLELYQQANARLHRQGQRMPVVVWRLCCRDTVDERMLEAIDGKGSYQGSVLRRLAEGEIRKSEHQNN